MTLPQIADRSSRARIENPSRWKSSEMKKTQSHLLFALILVCTLSSCASPHMATGIKIGEVTDSEAIVWVRLTKDEKRVDFGAPMPEVTYTLASTGEPIVDMQYRQRDAVPSVEFPDGSSINTIEGAVPGAKGVVRVHYKAGDDAKFQCHAVERCRSKSGLYATVPAIGSATRESIRHKSRIRRQQISRPQDPGGDFPYRARSPTQQRPLHSP